MKKHSRYTGTDDVPILHNTRFWAERGLIHMECMLTGHYGTMSVRDALERIRAINDMVGHSRRHRLEYFDRLYRDEHFVARMLGVIRKAQEQGTPDDPTARRDLVRRRKKHFVMPGEYGTLRL